MRSKTRDQMSAGASAGLVLTMAVAAQALTVFRIAATPDDEGFPSVSGNKVVWQFYNSRYGDWDVRGADISDPNAPVTFAISNTPGDDVFPVIDGNDVVWQYQSRPNVDRDICGANVADPRQVTRYVVSDWLDDECLPSVSQGVVVWQGRLVGAPDWDIWGARLTGKDHPDPFAVSATIDVNELYPCISGSLVVWNETTPDVPQPFAWGADISDTDKPRWFYTNVALGPHEIPSLSDGWLVGRESDGLGKVVADNLFDPFNPERISGSILTACPKIHKHLVVWQDEGNGTWDIRGYNLITRQEFAVTNLKMSDQVNPVVYYDARQKRAIIVWQDNRDGNWDVYGAIVDGPEVATEAKP